VSRHRGPSSYGHRVCYDRHGDYYVISWAFDRSYPGDRLRYPQSRRRTTDRKGAERFAKKWGVAIQNDAEPKQEGRR
jgi:hypothetical protein